MKAKKGKNKTDLNSTCASYYEPDNHSEVVGPPIKSRQSCPVKQTILASPGSLGGQTIYENEITDFESEIALNSPTHSPFSFEEVSSPPVHFYRNSSNPFGNVISPQRKRQDLPNTTQDKSYYSPRFHENTTAIVTMNLEDSFQQDDSKKRHSRNPTYKTVKNKYGEEVEYALPFSQKSDEFSLEDSKDSNDNQIPFDSTKHFHEYVDENFKFLNEKSRLEASKTIVQVTDLDKTDGTEKADEQQESALQELNSLTMWTKTIGIAKASSEELSESFESIEKDLVSDLFATIFL